MGMNALFKAFLKSVLSLAKRDIFTNLKNRCTIVPPPIQPFNHSTIQLLHYYTLIPLTLSSFSLGNDRAPP